MLNGAEETLRFWVHGLRICLEAIGALWIGIGCAYAFFELIAAHLRRRTQSFTRARILLSRYLSLALEFQLASDILSTAIAPSWEEIGKLAAVAVIRTGLNHFLSDDLGEYVEHQRAEGDLAGKTRPSLPA